MKKTTLETNFFALIAIYCFFLCLPTAQYGLVNYDDPWLIRDNVLLHSLKWEHLEKIWTNNSYHQRIRLGAEFLPLRDTWVMLEFALWGKNYKGHHFSQIVLFVLFVLCWCRFLYLWFPSPRFIGLFGILFASHAVHVEAFAWLSEKKGLLCGLFFALAGIFFTYFLREKRLHWWALAVLFFACSLWSKAIGITFPVFMLLLFFFFPKQSIPSEKSEPTARFDFRILLGFLGLFVASIVLFSPFWMTSKSVKMVSEIHGDSWLSTVWMMTQVHGKYLQLMVGLGQHSISYGIEPNQPTNVLHIVGLLGLLGLIVLFLFSLWKKGSTWKTIGFSIGMWFLFLAPVSQIFFPLQNILADRYLLMPSIGFCLLLALGIDAFFHKKIVKLLACVLVLCFSWKTIQTSKAWSSSLALYKNALEVAPNNTDVLITLSQETRQTQTQQSILWMEMAYQKDPQNARVLLQRALMYLSLQQAEKGFQAMKEAAKHPKGYRASANYAILLIRKAKYKEALKWATKSIKLQPNLAHTQRAYGLALINNFMPFQAEEAFRKVLLIEPYNKMNWVNLMVALQKQGKKQQAFEIMKKLQSR